jgi:hypothetical protein
MGRCAGAPRSMPRSCCTSALQFVFFLQKLCTAYAIVELKQKKRSHAIARPLSLNIQIGV